MVLGGQRTQSSAGKISLLSVLVTDHHGSHMGLPECTNSEVVHTGRKMMPIWPNVLEYKIVVPSSQSQIIPGKDQDARQAVNFKDHIAIFLDLNRYDGGAPKRIRPVLRYGEQSRRYQGVPDASDRKWNLSCIHVERSAW